MSARSDRLALETAAARLVRHLGGDWRPGGAMCLCPAHPDRTPSLSVRIGHTSLLFKCFAGCSVDAVMSAVRAMHFDVPFHPSAARIDDPGSETRSAALARDLWNRALPLAGTPGERYFASRLIRPRGRALRWLARTPLGRGTDVRFRPAIIAAVQEHGSIVAVQRLFVDPATARLASDIPRAKLTLGRPGSGAVRLMPCDAVLGLAEGIENAQSASDLLGLPVWATLGAERLHQIGIPQGVRRIVLLADRDRAGQRAQDIASTAYAARGFAVSTLWPWHGRNDWNDVLRKEGEGVGNGCGRSPDWQAGAAPEIPDDPTSN
jgi:putative DNA primase/helicase